MIKDILKTNKGKVITLTVLVIVAIIAVISAISTTAKQENMLYDLDRAGFADKSCKVIKRDFGVYVMGETESSFTLKSFDYKSGEHKEVLSKTNATLYAFDVQGDSVCVAYKSIGDKNSGISVETYNANDTSYYTNRFEIPTVGKIKVESIMLDSELNIVAIIGDNKISKYSNSGDVIYGYDTEDKVNGLYKDEDGNIYSQSGSKLLFAGDSEVKTIENTKLKEGITFLGKDLILCSNGYVFKLEDETLSYMFDTGCSSSVGCLRGDDIISLCSDRLLLLDTETHSEIGQYTIERTPSEIYAFEDAVLGVSQDNSKLYFEVLSNNPEDVAYLEQTTQDNSFWFALGEVIERESLSENDKWSIIFNDEVLSGGLRGNIKVELTYGDTTQILTTNDGVSFIEPNQIDFSVSPTLPAGNYHITVFGLCTKEGVPVKLMCDTEIVERESESSQISSDISSTTSSEISKEISSVNPAVASEVPANRKLKSNVYTIDREQGYILGVEEKTTVAQMKKNLEYSGELIFYKSNGAVLKSGAVGTGCRVDLIDNTTVIDSLYVIVTGDATGEGNINSRDLNTALSSILGQLTLTRFQSKALDVNKDGKFNNMDLTLLNAYANGRSSLSGK